MSRRRRHPALDLQIPDLPVVNLCEPSPRSRSWFDRLAKVAARLAGRPGTFVLAVTIILVWAITGPIFGYSDTWQLVINTSTTIVTFLMVFLIQNTQNRDMGAVQVKLDELLRAMQGARNSLIDLEDLSEEELDQVHAAYEKFAAEARKVAKKVERVEDEATEAVAHSRQK